MIKIAVIGIAAVMIAIQFKSVRNEYSLYISFAASVLIFAYVLLQMQSIVDTISQIKNYITIQGEYFTTLIKIIGITYIAEFSSSVCKDAGYSAVASQIEVFGKLSIFVVSMPILLALFDTIQNFLA